MGSIIRKRIRNILEISKDVFADMIGDGLHINREVFPVKIEVNTGEGLAFSESGALIVDMEVDPTKCTQYTQQTDTELMIDGRKLILKKVYTIFEICRNYDNYILDIKLIKQFEKFDEVIITDYSYVSVQNRSNRENSPAQPNFYRQ